MPRIDSLLRVLKRNAPTRCDKLSSATCVCEPKPDLITKAISQEINIAVVAIDSTDKKTIHTRVKRAIIQKASRIPRWTGTLDKLTKPEEPVCLLQKPVSISPAPKTKSAFFKVKLALRKGLKMHVSSPLELEPPTQAVSSPAPRLNVDIGTHSGEGFFDEEDIYAIINPIISEDAVITPPCGEFVPHRRRYRYWPPFKRVTTIIGRNVEVSVSVPSEATNPCNSVIGTACSVKSVLMVEPSLSLSLIDVLQPLGLSDAAPQILSSKVSARVQSDALSFVGGSCGSSSSVSSEDGSEDDSDSSTTDSPISPVHTTSDSDDPFVQFKRIHSARLHLLNEIINIQLEHAGKMNRSQPTSTSSSTITPNQDDVDNKATDMVAFEVSKGHIDISDLELSSVAAGTLCDPVSLRSADNTAAPPRASASVSSVHKAELSAMEDLDSSFPSLFNASTSLLSTASTHTSDGDDSIDQSRHIADGQGQRISLAPPSSYLPPPSPPNMLENMRALLRSISANSYRTELRGHLPMSNAGSSSEPAHSRRSIERKTVTSTPRLHAVGDIHRISFPRNRSASTSRLTTNISHQSMIPRHVFQRHQWAPTAVVAIVEQSQPVAPGPRSSMLPRRTSIR